MRGGTESACVDSHRQGQARKNGLIKSVKMPSSSADVEDTNKTDFYVIFIFVLLIRLWLVSLVNVSLIFTMNHRLITVQRLEDQINS